MGHMWPQWEGMSTHGECAALEMGTEEEWGQKGAEGCQESPSVSWTHPSIEPSATSPAEVQWGPRVVSLCWAPTHGR